ncbi:hypothetical protein [Loktanella sp. Alg231-35]|uniref:hypothetical protein n=1 Tax=Loktanella sp. Alg231-35 TaxID=1922220 RepID=UPI00131F261D|nr:hypothetical protein [Loktanella sp. Alg231-35]
MTGLSPDCELDFHAACARGTAIAANSLLIAPAAELNSRHSFVMQRGRKRNLAIAGPTELSLRLRPNPRLQKTERKFAQLVFIAALRQCRQRLLNRCYALGVNAALAYGYGMQSIR